MSSSKLTNTVAADKWALKVRAERIGYASEPPVAHWKAAETYKGAGLEYRGKPAERRPGINLVGKQNTVSGLIT